MLACECTCLLRSNFHLRCEILFLVVHHHDLLFAYANGLLLTILCLEFAGLLTIVDSEKEAAGLKKGL